MSKMDSGFSVQQITVIRTLRVSMTFLQTGSIEQGENADLGGGITTTCQVTASRWDGERASFEDAFLGCLSAPASDTHTHTHPCMHTYACVQLRPTLCDPMDHSPPGSSVHGIFQNTTVGCHFLLQHICIYTYICVYMYTYVHMFTGM